MQDICVDNFLMMCNPDHVERHSDSSDFENPEKILAIAPKSGNHRLLISKYCNSKHEKQFCNEFTMFQNTLSNNGRKTRRKSHQQCPNSHNRITNYGINYRFESNKIYSFNNRGDDNHCIMEKVNERSLMRDKVMPCLSIIFRRSNNNIKHAANIEEYKTDIINKCNRYCLNCKRRYMNELNGKQRYSAQPVYALEENVQTSPFQLRNDHECNNHKTNPISDVNYINLSTEADAESIKSYKYRKFLKSVKDKLEKEIRKEYYTVNDQQQQYPSKLRIKLPYQVYASTSCLANCSSTKMEGVAKVSSNSSAFWDFFAQKMNSNQEACECAKLSQPYSPTTYKNLSPAETPNKYNFNQINTKSCCQYPNMNSCCQQTEPSSSDSKTSTKKKNKENKEPNATCKCYSKGKQKSKSKPSPSKSQDNKSKPCQQSHDDIIRAISKKYNGEILCIHNPPCILINGCLNLSPAKSNLQGNLWPATQSKKYSFIQTCGKMQRSKQKPFDNASQYHPPYAELSRYLPEFRSEKTIQSICNHDPPCEIVHCCYRAKYDPKLQNSCVHVPMCGNLPECLLIEKNSENTLCKHNPKCAELPVCSRKYIVLSAKEEVGTQVRQKVKMVCRHDPHCLMIPKCLNQAISGDYIPYGAIPGCIHNPQCENIPACCRISFKEMVSVSSQYPNSCRIV